MAFIIPDLQDWHNEPGTNHYCNFLSLKPCRPYIITEADTMATVACPDTSRGYIYQRIKGGWVEITEGGG